MTMNSSDKLPSPNVKMNSHVTVPKEELYIPKDNGWTTTWTTTEVLVFQNRILLLPRRKASVWGSAQGYRINMIHLSETSFVLKDLRMGDKLNKT